MSEEETIYNIIKPHHIQEKHKTNYKSIYPKNLPPTGSTFGLKTTSIPVISNLGGEIEHPARAHPNMG